MSPVFLPSKSCVFYHTDCLEVILLVAEEYFLVRVLCFFSLLSQSSCLSVRKLGSLGRSLIVHVFSSVSWGYHRWGYGFGLVSVGTGGPSYDVEALAVIVRQGDEIIPLKIGPLVRFRSIDFLPFLLTTAGLFKDQKISVYKFVCLLFERHRWLSWWWGQASASSVWGERHLKGSFSLKKSKKEKNNKKNPQNGETTDVSGFEKREVTQVVGNSAASRSRSSSTLNSDLTLLAFLPHLAFMTFFWHSWHTWHSLTLLAHLALMIFLTHFDTLSTIGTATSLL